MNSINRKKEEKQFKHFEILKIARNVFNKKGFIKTTISQIAENSGYSIGTIYNFFQDKETLFEEVVKTIFSEFIIAFKKEVHSQGNIKDTIRKIVELRLKYFQKYKVFFNIFFQAAIEVEGVFSKNPKFLNTCLSYRDKYLNEIIQILQKNQKILINKEPLFLALTIEGTLNAIICYFSMTKQENSLSDSLNDIYKIFDGLIKT